MVPFETTPTNPASRRWYNSVSRGGRALGGAALLSAVLMLLSAAPARADDIPIQLTVGSMGDDQKDAEVKFTLVPPNGVGQAFTVPLKKPLTAAEKAAKIKKIVDETVVDGKKDWTADSANNTLTFKYKGKVVSKVEAATDGTGEKDKFFFAPVPTDKKAAFNFGLDGPGMASGVNGAGGPSLVYFACTAGTVIVPLNAGFPIVTAVDTVFGALTSWGAEVQRISPTALELRDGSPQPFVEVQCTDTAWTNQTKAIIVNAPEPASLALLALGGVGVARRRRSCWT